MKKVIEKRYRSRINSVVKAERLTDKVARQCELSEGTRADLCIAVTEAVNNAVLHGNNLEPDKYVSLRFDCSSSAIRIVISDEGNGFDLESVADPLAPENITKPNGRGLLILESLMDEVKVKPSSQGTRVEMVLKKR
jgi:serine/threonine-protein kinase RsbW